MKLALATCPDPGSPHVSDEALLVQALQARGVEVCWEDWHDPEVDWAGYDAVWIRTTWDYAQHVEAFLAWAERVEGVTRLINPAGVVRWNADKGYLDQLAEHGVPRIPTTRLTAGDDVAQAIEAACAAHGGRLMVKPAVGAGSDGTLRVLCDDAGSRVQAVAHVQEWLAHSDMLVQPYIDVEQTGEISVVCVDHVPHHALIKYPPSGSWKVQEEHGGRTEEVALTARMVMAARQALTAVERILSLDGPLLHARVDLLPLDGTFRVLEIELIEPSLFLAQGMGTADAFTEALLARLGEVTPPRSRGFDDR